MTQKEAKALSLEVWTYLAKHPECSTKGLLPDKLYKKIENLENRCPLCELFYAGGACAGCPLALVDKSCSDELSEYKHWLNSQGEDDDTRREAAGRIVKIISAWEPEEASDA